MKSITFLLVFLISFRFSAISQSNLQVLVSGGPTFTPKIKYNNSAGYISTVVTGSLGLVYRPVSTFGFELKFSDLSHPTSYLKNDTSNTVKIYTTSQIVLQRILAGFNYYLPLKSIKPFLGVITGATYAQTTQTAPQSSII